MPPFSPHIRPTRNASIDIMSRHNVQLRPSRPSGELRTSLETNSRQFFVPHRPRVVFESQLCSTGRRNWRSGFARMRRVRLEMDLSKLSISVVAFTLFFRVLFRSWIWVDKSSTSVNLPMLCLLFGQSRGHEVPWSSMLIPPSESDMKAASHLGWLV
jgi:hypothetical protein